jgi:hypothetical protein
MMFNKNDKNFWQSFVVIYTFAWLVVFIFGFVNQRFDRIPQGAILNSYLWLAIYAGGLGSIIGVLYSLYWRCVIKRDFQPQFAIYYVAQPVFGMAEGVMAYIAFGVGILLINSVLNVQIVAGSTIIMLLMVLSWIAGFRQYPIVWIRRLVRSFLSNIGYQ